MRLLLDTHAFLWRLIDDRQLSQAARQAIADDGDDVLVSAATAGEIATKRRIGRLPAAEALAGNIAGTIALESFEELPVSVDDASRAGALPGPLNDPFDRMLIAQALSRDLALVSNETIFERYGVRPLW